MCRYTALVTALILLTLFITLILSCLQPHHSGDDIQFNSTPSRVILLRSGNPDGKMTNLEVLTQKVKREEMTV